MERRNVMNCEAVSPRSPGLGVVLGAVAAWVVLVTALHITINGRVPLTAGAGARSLQVGGLPVT
jgi:hypothetical protein